MAVNTTEPGIALDLKRLSEDELEELKALGMLSVDGTLLPRPPSPMELGLPIISRRAISAPRVLNEAYDYTHYPVSFSRGLRIELNGVTQLLISGTASVDEEGRSAHSGDLRAQCWRTYHNLTRLLEAEGASWHDVVRCTCYLRDIERDYKDFNAVRTAFFRWLGLDPLPASTGIQARLCREDLLVEIELIALIPSERQRERSG
jgi:enamine deaminase RidA (YjgF/YER057c/UK114 family)